jgi:large subunit ribosomal protein L20
MYGLKLAKVELNRKALSELAIREPKDFDSIVILSKQALATKPATRAVAQS